jgi:hypothetical protein
MLFLSKKFFLRKKQLRCGKMQLDDFLRNLRLLLLHLLLLRLN